MVRLLAGTHKLQFHRAALYLGGSIVPENRQVAPFQPSRHLGSNFNTAPDGNEVDIGRRPAQHYVAHIAAYHIAFAAKRISSLSHEVKHGFVDCRAQGFGRYCRCHATFILHILPFPLISDLKKLFNVLGDFRTQWLFTRLSSQKTMPTSTQISCTISSGALVRERAPVSSIT